MILELHNIIYEKNDTKLLDIEKFSINKGDYVFIIGPNGSGKSTFSLLLCGLITKYSGSILLNKKEVSSKELIKNVGIIFQNYENQFFASVVKSDVAFGLENQNIKDKKIMDEKVNQALEEVGILDLKERDINSLSGGQKQMVAIASIIALNKEIIIFDESTSMLDNETKKRIDNLILQLNKKGKTIIRISHLKIDGKNSNVVYSFKKGKIELYDNFKY